MKLLALTPELEDKIGIEIEWSRLEMLEFEKDLTKILGILSLLDKELYFHLPPGYPYFRESLRESKNKNSNFILTSYYTKGFQEESKNKHKFYLLPEITAFFNRVTGKLDFIYPPINGELSWPKFYPAFDEFLKLFNTRNDYYFINDLIKNENAS